MFTIGIDLGGTNIKSALVDDKRGIVFKSSISTEADRGVNHVINRIAEAINLAAEESPELPRGVGIGAPGVISLDRTTVSNPPNIPGWNQINLSSELKKKTGFNCYVDNDANLMALGSSRFGEGRAFDSFIMITLGTGVGGGIIYNGKLFRGTTGGAAELGHVTIDYKGPLSNSPTRGGIEAYLGQRFLSDIAWKEIQKHPEDSLYKEFFGKNDQLEPKHLSDAANEGNQLALKILSDAGRKLGIVIVNYVHILDIRKIIVSGGVAQAGNLILDSARESAHEYMMEPFKNGFEIIYENLGNYAAVLGAAILPYEYIAA